MQVIQAISSYQCLWCFDAHKSLFLVDGSIGLQLVPSIYGIIVYSSPFTHEIWIIELLGVIIVFLGRLHHSGNGCRGTLSTQRVFPDEITLTWVVLALAKVEFWMPLTLLISIVLLNSDDMASGSSDLLLLSWKLLRARGHFIHNVDLLFIGVFYQDLMFFGGISVWKPDFDFFHSKYFICRIEYKGR